MSFKYMYITNNPDIAKIAEDNGVDWIFIDLEINGKEDRQGHLDTVISRHSQEDIKKVKRVISKSKLLVRVNPIHEKSQQEIDNVINSGAEIIMLPFFKSSHEVETFVNIVDHRAEVCLLLETPEAVDDLDSILKVDDIKYVHIGLNDLHLGYGQTFMFELLADGTVERICSKLREAEIEYGFGGVAELGEGDLPAEIILKEHQRLGSSMAILSRSFCNPGSTTDLSNIKRNFEIGVKKLREYQHELLFRNASYFIENKNVLDEKVESIKIRKEMRKYEETVTYRRI